MCIFSKPVVSVASTHIFVRRNLRDNRHVTVYQMEAALMGENAMILPVPGSHVEFVNLEGYPDFFKDMDALFPSNISKGITRGRSMDMSYSLPVYDVGDYIASYVPSMDDWDRIDPVFKLDNNCWKELPDYSEFSFVVFQLKAANDGVKKFHPMAYTYNADSNDLFFPTTHVHDGKVEKTSLYDHKLYYQFDEGYMYIPSSRSVRGVWESSVQPVNAKMDVKKTLGLVSGIAPVARLHLDKVQLPNQDIVLKYSDDEVTMHLNKIRGKQETFGVNEFAGERHFSQDNGYTYTIMTYKELCAEIAKNWDKRKPGKGETSLERKVVVPISNEYVYGTFTTIKPDMQITSKVVQRQAGEDYFIESKVAYRDGSPVRNKFAKVVLYSREALLENDGTCSTDADWEVVCLISSDVDDEPMQPLALARNYLQKPGGTFGDYTAQDFAESIYYWSQRIKI